MKVFVYIAALLLAVIARSNAFVTPTGSHALTAATSTQLGLFGLFDSPEEKERKKEAKLREIEEQEEAQRELLETRRNPDKMDEYMARVSVRRKLYMAGEDEKANQFKVMKDKKQE